MVVSEDLGASRNGLDISRCNSVEISKLVVVFSKHRKLQSSSEVTVFIRGLHIYAYARYVCKGIGPVKSFKIEHQDRLIITYLF